MDHAPTMHPQSIIAVPILPDYSPAEVRAAEEFVVDTATGDVRFVVRSLSTLPTRFLLVGTKSAAVELHYATVEASHIDSTAGGLDIRGRFVNGDEDLIRPENLEPTLRTDSYQYRTRMPQEVLSKWVNCGVLRPVLFDRVMQCPTCRGLATFRNGCRACGSVQLHSRPLIHHFACAHVDFVDLFESNGLLICPKCRTRNLIVGADFEHLQGPFRCLDCGWSDTELELVGRCMACDLRFPGNQAIEQDLVGYHVHRLDPLALLNAA